MSGFQFQKKIGDFLVEGQECGEEEISLQVRHKGSQRVWKGQFKSLETEVTGYQLPACKVLGAFEKISALVFQFPPLPCPEEALTLAIAFPFVDETKNAFCNLKETELTEDMKVQDLVDRITNTRQNFVSPGKTHISAENTFKFEAIPDRNSETCIVTVDFWAASNDCSWVYWDVKNGNTLITPSNGTYCPASPSYPLPHHAKMITSVVEGVPVVLSVLNTQSYAVPWVQDVVITLEYL